MSQEAVLTKAEIWVSIERAALYLRVSTVDQHRETRGYDLRALAAQRGYEIVHEYQDMISGGKSKCLGLDQTMAVARRSRYFDVVVVWAFDRMARSVSRTRGHRLGVRIVA